MHDGARGIALGCDTRAATAAPRPRNPAPRAIIFKPIRIAARPAQFLRGNVTPRVRSTGTLVCAKSWNSADPAHPPSPTIPPASGGSPIGERIAVLSAIL